ncbi:murein peptide amidase A [Vibrio sp. 10N.286.49.C2]|uniref:murein tripeptide amidase MpaA n=1 Tax=unclassified Vibrio TaxID=2614977 RepID=UPI000C848F34|nr:MULTISPECIES: murein tripeptide amidase MpaA [unclassified Vibrio]PMH31551.1 murein peptide amidase A [Vibrio sp. 10N.286.49.C2]PMH50573.1 murein peptide amidase A [Vibrio sp. 10N.286.49.B1]PMH82270.1 murein peptide amidase A [Vibrio sp. 10N.286.48.B7]
MHKPFKPHKLTKTDDSIEGHVPRQERAQFLIQPDIFGRSVFNAPLLFFPAQVDSNDRGLILAGTHGDEAGAIALLSAALRSLQPNQLRHDIVLSINPDGNQLGTRANAHQVDLNRAFPSANWTPNGTTYRWSTNNKDRDVDVATGNATTLEPEIDALIKLIRTRKPSFIVSIHEPLACVDDPEESTLGYWIASHFALPLVTDIGYDTPGSFGSWCKEQAIPCVTLELPNTSADQLTIDYLEPTMALMRYISAG